LERQFEETTRVSELITEVRPLVATWPWPIAEANQDYNWSCVIDERIPAKRLLVVGRSGDLYAVLYESGGYPGPHPTLVLARLREDHVAAYCKIPMPHAVATIEAAKDAISPDRRPFDSYACR
jgi:hypothetical protein